jgi:hypothetical protein
MTTLLISLLNKDSYELVLFCLLIFPWFFGSAVMLTILHNKYSNWLWKGMDAEKRYFYIKASKW